MCCFVAREIQLAPTDWLNKTFSEILGLALTFMLPEVIVIEVFLFLKFLFLKYYKGITFSKTFPSLYIGYENLLK